MPNLALRQAKADVPADSSLATDDTTNQPTPDTDAGDQSDDKGAGKGGRSLDEVRGEFNRKFEDLKSDLNGKFSRLEEVLQGTKADQKPSGSEGTKDLNDMTSAELESLRPHIPEDKKSAYEDLLRARREEERVDARVERRLSKHEVTQVRKQSNSEAYSRYPELHNESGALYRAVNKVLDEWGDALTKNNPHAVLQAANEAAHRLGIKPKAVTEYTSGRPNGRSAPAPRSDAGGKELTVAESEDIARRLRNALPAGKTFSPEVLADVRKRSGEYNKHRDLFIKK